jgi:hypothetical protein
VLRLSCQCWTGGGYHPLRTRITIDGGDLKRTPLATQPPGLLDSTAKQGSAWSKPLPACKALLSSESALQVHSGGPLCDVGVLKPGDTRTESLQVSTSSTTQKNQRQLKFVPIFHFYCILEDWEGTGICQSHCLYFVMKPLPS